MARAPLVAGNWKMHGTRARVQELVHAVCAGLPEARAAEVAVFPPYVYLPAVADAADGRIGWGAQNLSEFDEGAHTGEISGAMLADAGCRYVIVGHSERRAHDHESSARVAQKFAAARRHGLAPVLCVGETLDQREAGETQAVIGRQLDAVLDHAGIEEFAGAVIAYEPVWAIGTGKTARPEQAQEIHAWIRDKLNVLDATIGGRVRLLYGGSVKGANAAELFSMPDIDGGLVGGASLKANEFLAIIEAAG